MDDETRAQREAERYVREASESRYGTIGEALPGSPQALSASHRSTRVEDAERRARAWLESTHATAQYNRASKWLANGYRLRDFWWLRIVTPAKDAALIGGGIAVLLLASAAMTDLQELLGLGGRR
jgi:hypothetical protein